MKTLHRQDGSLVDLTDADAEKWLKLGLATAPSVTVPAKTTKPVNDTKGASK